MTSNKTLGKALELGAEAVIVRCTNCFNVRRFSAAQARKNWPADISFEELKKRTRCRCGRHAAQAEPLWPMRARGGSEPQPLVPKEWGRF